MKKNYVLKATLLCLFASVMLAFWAEEILKMYSEKTWYFISVPVGILFFIYQFIFGRTGIAIKIFRFNEYIIEKGQGEESVLKLEEIIIARYNRKHLFHRVGETMMKNKNYRELITNDFPMVSDLSILSILYFYNGKEDRAIQIIEQIHDFNTKELNQQLYGIAITLIYLDTLKVYMELEDMNKTEMYLLEAEPYMEIYKDEKKNFVGPLICLTYIRYQYLKGNYEYALQLLHQYSFPENKVIQMGKYRMKSFLYYALEDMEQSTKYLKQAEENCTNQWMKDRLYFEYESMKKRMGENRTRQPYFINLCIT